VTQLDVIAIIPARGGSKRIPRKNLVAVGGKPLLSHTVWHALNAKAVGAVYVSTDDDEIADHARVWGAEVVIRPPELASDAATSEAALIHVLDMRLQNGLADPDLVVFLQCTCPVRAPDDIDRAVETLRQSGSDSLFSGCRETPFIWCIGSGGPQSVTYDYRTRRRTQDWRPHYRENGSIYVFRPWVLRQNSNRIGGKIAVYEMDYWSSFDVDSNEDLLLVQWIFERMKAELSVAQISQP
jgi:CMP-N,N'-diacetyllegionaminic acid synthase